LFKDTNFEVSTKPAIIFTLCYQLAILHVLILALAKTYSFAILAYVLAGANCKCVWL